MTTPPPDTKVQSEALGRSCLMCKAVRRVIAKVGPLEIKEPCPCKCGPGYFEPSGRTVKKAIREGR